MQITSLAKAHAELFAEKGAQAVRDALPKKVKENDLDEEDRIEIIKRLESGEVKADPKPKEEPKAAKPGKAAKPKEEQDGRGSELDAFDYNMLQGDTWKAYKAQIEGKLIRNKQYTFGVYKVEPIKRERYPGVPNSPIDVVGIRLVKDKPVRTIRLEANYALNLNAQLPGATSRVPMEYYLLAK